MNTRIIKFNKPEEKEIVVHLLSNGQQEELVCVVDARVMGKFGLKIVMDHKAKSTIGRIKIRGVVDAGASLEIEGVIKINKIAEDTDSFLEIRVLQLDNKSMVAIKPILEIENNKVKASHAAAVSKVDSDQIYYLMSRGLNKKEAEDQIVEGFINDYQLT